MWLTLQTENLSKYVIFIYQTFPFHIFRWPCIPNLIFQWLFHYAYPGMQGLAFRGYEEARENLSVSRHVIRDNYLELFALILL